MTNINTIKYNIKTIIIELINCMKYLMLQPCDKTTKFVIFGRGRSGSTVLVSLLNSLPDIYCDGEIYHNKVFFPKIHMKRKCYQSQSKIYGFKFLTYQLLRYPDKFQIPFLEYLLRNNYRVIYLKRKNLLMHAISNIRAREFGFHNKTNNDREKKKIYIEIHELFKWLQGSEKQAIKEELLLKKIPHLKIIYEENLENTKNHQQTMDIICEFLNINKGKVKTEYKKVSPSKIENSIENFEEISKKLKNTTFEKYLYY